MPSLNDIFKLENAFEGSWGLKICLWRAQAQVYSETTAAVCVKNKGANNDLKTYIMNEDTLKDDDKRFNIILVWPTGMFCLTYFQCSALPSKPHITVAISTTSPDTNAAPSNTSIARPWFRFGIHPSTASRMFASILEVIYVQLKLLMNWPKWEILQWSLLMDFRKYCSLFKVCRVQSTNVLILCKHRNTANYHISITPQGSVSFVSKVWGVRVSDKHLTENSSLLQNLLQGETVLVDGGFDIKESVGVYCATITLPVSMKGKEQLSLKLNWNWTIMHS